MKVESRFPRGSEWRQWDLHVHTPASFHWTGQKFVGDASSPANRALVDQMIDALNNAEPAVFALMDYWTFEGWFALQRRLKEVDAPKLTKTVFPGIELRLMAPMTGRLNAHALFSDRVADQVLRDFKAALQVEVVARPLSDDSLIELARRVTEAKLKHHGFSKNEVDSNPIKALLAGATIAEINCESYKTAIANVPDGQALGFMPYDSNDGLSDVKWSDNYAYFAGLVKTSPIFECRSQDVRGAFVGEKTVGNEKYIDSFQKGLAGVPRLAVSGSDAHCFVGVKGDNNKRGYGDFPSEKITWIKADPSFRGLLQAIKEPSKRSYIGKQPPKQAEIASNKTYFIDSISISRVAGPATADEWLNGTALPLNPDLVAIIGNKGSGKSALADVIALAGNSKQKSHFSFLKKERFRGKSGDPARNFSATLVWHDGNLESRNLNEDPPEEKVELVRYIPQGHFEDLCNAHVSGRSNAFENELRAVIFSHTDDSIRLGAHDFDQLIEQQESGFRDQLNEYRKELHRLNEEISGIEDQLQPDVRGTLQELAAQKSREIDEHNKVRPLSMVKPADHLSEEQQQAAAALEEITVKLKLLNETAASNSTGISSSAGRQKASQNIRERVRLLERAYKQFEEDTAKDMTALGLDVKDVASLQVATAPLDEIETKILAQQEALKASNLVIVVEQTKLTSDQTKYKTQLNAPQLQYQENLKAIGTWQAKAAELKGTPEGPETELGLRARIAQIDTLPEILTERREQRASLTYEIFGILDTQRHAREDLFKPVQDLIQSNSLIRDEYKLRFQATLGGSADGISTALFALVKQNSGEFRGEDESFAAVRKLAEQYDFNESAGPLSFVNQLHDKLASAANPGKGGIGISSILRKDRSAIEVYDLLYGLSFLEPRYSLLFQDAQIEQLSPGQRGALLLIFYLLVDKGRTPIILDQPEENLDNETVVSLLVPVLSEAKRRRQIIMVTHNPNLAVVCDAEQIIWSTFDRKNASRIAYLSGAIEDPEINAHVVDVLEGTMPAFNNRGSKYY
jgi:ABC-type lipoprotein export system ATPase subunit